HEPIARFANVVGVFAIVRRAAFHQQGHAGNASHGGGKLTAPSLPVAVAVLILSQPLEAFVHTVPYSRFQLFGPRKVCSSPQCPKSARSTYEEAKGSHGCGLLETR